jgi:hypothetical protein
MIQRMPTIINPAAGTVRQVGGVALFSGVPFASERARFCRAKASGLNKEPQKRAVETRLS